MGAGRAVAASRPLREAREVDASPRPSRRSPGRPRAADAVSLDDILLAALQAFAERGYDGMSVRELNARLGGSHNLISERIGRKDDLWRAVVERFVGEATESIIVMARAATGSPAERLTALRAVWIEMVVANARRPELLRMMTVEASTEGERLAELFERFVRPTAQAMGELYASLVADGVLRALPAASLFFLLAHGATGPSSHAPLAARLGVRDATDPAWVERHAVAVVDTLLAGLRVDRDGSPAIS